ncbi:MAG TPA: hypothetical protein VG929_08330 [Actinomycetota bacterium]|nr:hypothetical protein [Actinomycetota bacterium]
MVSVIAAVSVALVVSGCGTDVAPPAAGADDVVSHTPAPDPLDPAGPERVEPRDGLVEVRATRWDRYRVRDGGRATDLFFWSGVEDCYGVDRVEVDYKKRTVEVTIFEGREPAAAVCIELAVRKVVQVPLEEGIGERKVVDGGAEG